MNWKKLALAAAAAAALAACEKKPAEPAKPATAAASPAVPAAAAPREAAKEEPMEAPDTHGMPGMSELFKGKDEKK